MAKIVGIISNAVESGFRKIKSRIHELNIQTPAQASPFGIDSAPPAGMTGLYIETEKNGKPALIGYFNKSLLAADGEFRIYSVDNDRNLSAYIWLKADGTILLGGDAGNAVRFEELKDGFDQLVSDHNDLVAAFNQHVHASNGVIATVVPGVIPASNSDASVDDSKIDEIKTL
jgi:hypothetical protein